MAEKKREKLTGDFKEFLLNELRDPQLASEYLNAAIEDGDISVFLMALGDVVKAQGMSKVSKKAGLNRENAYRIVKSEGNPRIKSVAALLDAIGVKITTEPILKTPRAVTKANVRSFEGFAEVQAGFEVHQLEPIKPEIEDVSFGAGKCYIPSPRMFMDLACAA